MTSGGFLVPPSEKSEGSEIWEETWKRVDRFLPDLYVEIFPGVNESTTSTVEKIETGGNLSVVEPSKEKADNE